MTKRMQDHEWYKAIKADLQPNLPPEVEEAIIGSITHILSQGYVEGEPLRKRYQKYACAECGNLDWHACGCSER